MATFIALTLLLVQICDSSTTETSRPFDPFDQSMESYSSQSANITPRKLAETNPLGLKAEFRVDSTGSSNTYNPIPAVFSDQGFVVVWQSYSDADDYAVAGQLFNPDESSVDSTEFRINQTTNNNQRIPFAAVYSGGFVAAYEAQSIEDGYGIYAKSYTQAGSASSRERINSTTSNDQRRVTMCTLTTDHIVYAYASDNQSPDSSSSGIFARVFTSGTTGGGTEFLVNTYTTGEQFAPSVACLTGGGFVVAWDSESQDGSGDGIYAQMYDNNSNAVGGEFRVNTNTSGNQYDPSAEPLEDGSFIIVWETESGNNSGNRDIAARIFDSNGKPFSNEFKVSSHSNQQENHCGVVGLKDGGFIIVWEESGTNSSGFDVFVKRYDKDFNKVDDEYIVNSTTSGDQRDPEAAAFDDGGFIVCYSDSAQYIRCRIARRCSDINCTSCNTDIDTCTACAAGYYLTGGACVLCHESCLSCTGTAANQCAACPDGIAPTTDGYCQCPTGTVTAWPDPLLCGTCSANCAICKCSDCDTAGVTVSSPIACLSCMAGYFLNNSECVECEDKCLECSDRDTCTLCESQFTLSNGNCVCETNYFYNSATNSCEYIILTYQLSAHQSSFTLTFSEPLQTNLGLSNSYYYPSGTSFTFTQTVISTTQYRLELPGFAPSGTTEVRFELGNVQSVSGSMLSGSDHSVKISYISVEDTQTASSSTSSISIPESTVTSTQNVSTSDDKELVNGESGEDIAVYIIITWLSISFCLSITTKSLVPVWTVINTCMMIYYIPLMNSELPKAIHSFCKGFKPDLLGVIPNLADLFQIDESGYPRAPSVFYDYGIETTSLFINVGEILFLFLAILGLLPLLSLIYCFSGCSEKVGNLLKEFRWNYFLRSWILMYTELMIASLLSAYTISDSMVEIEIEQVVSVIILSMGLISPIVIFSLTVRYKKSINNQMDSFKSYSALYSGLEKEEGVSCLLFHPIFFVQRVFFIAGIYYFEDYAFGQVLFNSSFSVIFLAYMVSFKPFENYALLVFQFYCELALLTMFVISGVNIGDFSDGTGDVLGYVVFGIFVTILVLSVIICLWSIGNRNKKLNWKEIIRTKIQPIQEESSVLDKTTTLFRVRRKPGSSNTSENRDRRRSASSNSSILRDGSERRVFRN